MSAQLQLHGDSHFFNYNHAICEYTCIASAYEGQLNRMLRHLGHLFYPQNLLGTAPSRCSHPRSLAGGCFLVSALLLMTSPGTLAHEATALRGGTPSKRFQTPRRQLSGTSKLSTDVSTGFAHSCAVIAGGKVVCWGAGDDGRIGYGNTNNIGDDELPSIAGTVFLGDGVVAKQVSAGGAHTCALVGNGKVMCWGHGEYGNLGYGNTQNIGDDELPSSAGAVQLGDGRIATQVTTGAAFTCALLQTEDVMCWGAGANGRTGRGNTDTIGDDETPASAGLVQLGSGAKVLHISTTQRHTCALLASGQVMCWGEALFGALGYGNVNDVGDDETPASVGAVQVGGSVSVAQVSAGFDHTCVLLQDGTVKCWGRGEYGRLGYGNVNDIGDDELPSAVGTVQLGADVIVTQVAAGDQHTCVLLNTGHVKCWGSAYYGELGYGNKNDIGDDELPSAVGVVPLGDGVNVAKISAGTYVTCALLSSGDVTCWGDGKFGRVGYGNTNNIGDDEVPSMAGTLRLSKGVSLNRITAGHSHSCAVIAGGEVVCWGAGVYGNLGYGNTDNVGENELPSTAGTVRLGDGVVATQVSIAETHTCALMDDGEVMCWGMGQYGNLGYGNTNNIGDDELPSSAGSVQLGAGRIATQVTTGAAFTCALLLTADG